MANPIVVTTFADADPNASPIDVNDLIALLRQLVSSQIQGSYVPYVLQHDAPGVDDQDKAWIELDTAGRPIALKVWYAGNPGAWRRVYNGMIGEIRGYSGDPTDDFTANADGVYGAGKIGEQYDGWYLCNGANGTPNLSDKFLLGAHMDKSNTHPAYDNGWVSSITGPDASTHDYKTGGRFIESLIEDNLPLLSNAAEDDVPGLWIYGKAWKDGASHPGNTFPIVDEEYANQRPFNINLTEGAIGGAYGKTPPTPVWTTPPFVSLGWIIFKGY